MLAEQSKMTLKHTTEIDLNQWEEKLEVHTEGVLLLNNAFIIMKEMEDIPPCYR